MVDTAHSFTMQATNSMSQRITEIIGSDSLRAVARKLALHGVEVSPQAVQKWKNGGDITIENIEALAAAYHSTPAYIRYGTGPAHPLSDKQAAAAELVEAEEIQEIVQEGCDFIRYKVENSALTSKDPKAMAKYFKLLDILTGTPGKSRGKN